MSHEHTDPEPIPADLAGLLVHLRSEAFASTEPGEGQTAMFRLTLTIRTYPEHATKHIVVVIPGTASFQDFVAQLTGALVTAALTTGEVESVKSKPDPSRN